MAPLIFDGAGTISGLQAGGLPDSSVTTADIANSAITAAKIGYAGAILQVVQGSSDSVVSGAGSAWVANPATVSITTSSASSKVLLLFHSSAWGTSLNDMGYRFLRGTTPIGVATSGTYAMKATQLNAVQYAVSYVLNPVSMNFLDSPGAAGTYTYSVEGQIQGPSGAGLFQWNATIGTTGSDSAQCLSVLIAMEVQG